MAREVGTEGTLGGQAEVKGVGRHVWKDLTDSVNSMAGTGPEAALGLVEQEGSKELQKMRAFKTFLDSAEVVEFKDGNSPSNAANASYGYLYIGAWQYWPRTAGTSRRNQTPPQSGAATSPGPASARRSGPASTAMARRRRRLFRRTRLPGHRGRLTKGKRPTYTRGRVATPNGFCSSASI